VHVRNAEKSLECTLIEDKGQLTLVAPDLAALGEYAARFQTFGYEQSCIRIKKRPAGEPLVGRITVQPVSTPVGKELSYETQEHRGCL
jgi:hypothetical protein